MYHIYVDDVDTAFSKVVEGGRQSQNASGRYFLAEWLWPNRRSLRPSLVSCNTYSRFYTRRDREKGKRVYETKFVRAQKVGVIIS